MKNFIIFILLLGIIGMFLFATNPSKAEFVEYYKNRVIDKYKSPNIKSDDLINSLANSIAGSFSGLAADALYTRNDYVLFSVYESSGAEEKYLGVMKMFIPIG